MKVTGFYINSATDPFIHDFKLTNEGGFHFETQNELDTFVSRLKYAFSLYMDSVVVVQTFEEREDYTKCKPGEKLNSKGDCVANEPII